MARPNCPRQAQDPLRLTRIRTNDQGKLATKGTKGVSCGEILRGKRMSRSLRFATLCLLVAALCWILPLAAQKGSPAGQWLSYSADHGSTGYSSADLINRDNVKNLQIAWSWKFDNFGATSTEVTPIMVNGILYFPLS